MEKVPSSSQGQVDFLAGQVYFKEKNVRPACLKDLSSNPSFKLCVDNTLVFLFFMIVRMSRVCRHWRQVASEPRLWRTVNLSTSYVKISASPSILQQLAPERLKYVRQLFLGGWSKLTDKGIEVW